jgi:DNA-binding GntR family transcriptional regulator
VRASPPTSNLTAQNAPPSGPSTTPQHALDGLRRLIVNGTLRPGQRVPQEDLASRLGVSIAPVREALRTLEQEGQVTYFPRRGYFVTALEIADLEEIYELRSILEARQARRALLTLDEAAVEQIVLAARDCASSVEHGDVAAELQANRRFHFEILAAPDRPQTMRVIRQLWDSTEAYRALYYNLPAERQASIEAHERILAAIRERNADRLIAELDAHRDRALAILREILTHS